MGTEPGATESRACTSREANVPDKEFVSTSCLQHQEFQAKRSFAGQSRSHPTFPSQQSPRGGHDEAVLALRAVGLWGQRS